MIRSIIHDPVFLSKKASPAERSDIATTGRDLIDTLIANRQVCAGLAANMIGVAKSLIVFFDENAETLLMCNPEVLDKRGAFDAKEQCLSLNGERQTKRYRMIAVRYRDEHWQQKTRKFFGWTAQIIQHEIDHTNGILI